MLEIAKKQKEIGQYTHIALGKYSLPFRLIDGYKQLKYEIWARR